MVTSTDPEADTVDISGILAPWIDGEADTRDEQNFTPWAEAGWESWNASSAEVAFAESAGKLAATAGGTVVETGVGQGYTTRRLAASGVDVYAYESWDRVREAVRPHLPGNVTIPDVPSPPAAIVAQAELVVLDSSRPYRPREIRRWAEHGTGLCLIHDTGNGHQDHHTHMRTRRLILQLELTGLLYGNPRGSALLWKSRPDDDLLGKVAMPVLHTVTDGQLG